MAVKHGIEGGHVVPVGKANALLIEGQDGLMLIDTGFPHEEAAVFKAIRGLGHRSADFKHVIFTHGHPERPGGTSAKS
jgi:glyoxylase-like metal-dependent hydrolase (beta-lactamase superfamily II)